MQFKHSLSFVFLAIACHGCDPAFYVYVSNKSLTEKHIQVIYPQNTLNKPTDSLAAYHNTAKNKYTTTFKLPILFNDTAACMYMFTLPAGIDAQIGRAGIGVLGPYLNQTIIINNKDTIAMTRSNKQLTKRHTLLLTGELWKYTINN